MRRALIVLGAAATLTLAGCSEADIELPGSGPNAVPESPPATEAVVPGADPTSASEPLPDGECQSLPTDDDGDYAAADAGTATVRLEGDALVLDEVVPAEGWEYTVDTEEATEIEVAFTGDGGAYDLRVEIGDNGLPEVEVCAD